jgi:hypothetical protein
VGFVKEGSLKEMKTQSSLKRQQRKSKEETENVMVAEKIALS